MALLARCPACDCELELPAEAQDASDEMRLECPACSHAFSQSETQTRTVLSARAIDGSSSAVERESNQTAGSEERFGASTLASFLDGDSAAAEPDGNQPVEDSPQHVNLGEFKSLDDLFNKVSAGPVSAESSDAPPTGENDEPSPVAERMRPVLDENPATTGELQPSSESPSKVADECNSIDEILDSLSDIEDDRSAKTEIPSQEHQEPTSPTFDFSAGDDQTADTSAGLRAAMGFAPSDVLEPEEVSVDTGQVEHDVQFSGVEAPSGSVPARKRSSNSLARTMMGVVGGGVVALIVSPLAVMWINHFRGNPVEPFGVAHFYPDMIKPAEFRSTATPEAEADDTDQADPRVAADNRSNGNNNRGGVVPSNFEEPVTGSTSERPREWNDNDTPSEPIEPKRVSIADAPVYPAAKIMQWTTDSREATGGLLKGSFDREERLRPVKGASYATIAKLADAVTFGEGAADSSWIYKASQVFPPLFESPQSRYEISLIASYWVTSNRRPHGGIFFCGTPDAGRQQGSVAEYVFTLPIPDKTQMTVVIPQAMNSSLTSAPALGVVGSVIDNPAERIEGYTGNAKRVIWSKQVFPLGE